jgi:hypothetical protein
MNPPRPDSRPPGTPTTDDLAGTPVCREEDHTLIRGRNGNSPGGAPPGPGPNGPPTADDLAGIPVSAEGEEDLTVRPRQPRP